MILPDGVVSKKDIGAVSVESKRAEKSYSGTEATITYETKMEKEQKALNSQTRGDVAVPTLIYLH